MRRAYAGLLLALSGCDPTAGLADSADAAMPQIKRYFDGPGSQLSAGPWNRVVVDLDVETLYHVGARRSDDEEPTFHLFGADARQGCEVAPNAGTWLMGKPRLAPYRLLPFVEDMDERGRGRLRFTTLDCAVQDLVLEDAGRPYPRLYDRGYLIPTGRGYTFADPWQGEARVIARDLTDVLIWEADGVLLWADDELKSFSEQFDVGSEWGSSPVAAVPIQRVSFLVEDADGLHHVGLDRQTLEIGHEQVLPGACNLQRSTVVASDGSSIWVAVQQPCDDPKPSILHLDSVSLEVLDSFQLPFETDARYVRALVGTAVDGEAVPLAAVYLTDVGDDGLGTLWAWRAGAGEPFELGEHADLDGAVLKAPDSGWDGLAEVNAQSIGGYLAHDRIQFRWDGTTSILAEHVVRNSSTGEVLVNFDGVAGDLAIFDDDGYGVLAQGVPPYSGEAISTTGDRHYARVDHFDGEAGRLLLSTDLPGSSSAVGAQVPPDFARFSWFMPALVFIEHYDAVARSGSLVAYNYELDARSVIAEGVSSFDLTSYPWDGVVYTVPSGARQGIWFAKAK
jgi:hypothetical protein